MRRPFYNNGKNKLTYDDHLFNQELFCLITKKKGAKYWNRKLIGYDLGSMNIDFAFVADALED